MFQEKDMQDILAMHPEIIEKGMEFIKKEEPLYGRRTDLLLKDQEGREVVVELKNTDITYEHVGQLIWYTGALLRAGIQTPRMFLIGRKVHPVLQTAFEKFGIEWREYDPAFLIQYLKRIESPLYYKYQQIENDSKKLKARTVSFEPKRMMVATSQAELNVETTKRFKGWFLNSHIPVQKIGPFFLVFHDKVEEVVKGTGHWVGEQRRFTLIKEDLVCEGTAYFGSSGTAGKEYEYYLEGESPYYLALDIGVAAKSGEPFQTGNHTYCLKLPLHRFVEYPSGNLSIDIPIKGPGLKDHKEEIYHWLSEWKISQSLFIHGSMHDDSSVWEFTRSIVAVGLLKQIVKKRIKVELTSRL